MGGTGPVELVLVFLLILGVPVLYVTSIVWAFRDAESRGTNGMLAAILVAVAIWPLSIVVWILIRPNNGT